MTNVKQQCKNLTKNIFWNLTDTKSTTSKELTTLDPPSLFLFEFYKEDK